MCDHLGGSHADDLVVSLIGSLELQDYPPDDQVDNLWELGIDDGNKGGVDVCEVG